MLAFQKRDFYFFFKYFWFQKTGADLNIKKNGKLKKIKWGGQKIAF